MRAPPICGALRATAAPIALLAATALPLAAQHDSVTVVPGERYEARSELHTTLLGEGYRALWTEPIRAPVLDVERYDGGLTAVSSGGQKQTQSLRFETPSGREYSFRSVDKEMTPAMPEYARETFLDWLRQDLTAAQLPTSPLVATPLLDAVGVLNPGPRLYVLPDHPALGEFRPRFAGMLGTLEIHANELENGEGFAGAVTVAGTDRLLEHLEESAVSRVDGRAFLKARLMDVFLGDFDRHVGQWRWARYDRDGTHWWVPVPEDRDYAFVRYDGLGLELARAMGMRRLVRFDGSYPDLLGMVDNSLDLTRSLLAELPRAAWDSTAAALQGALTDEVIVAAVRRMPPSHVAIAGAELSAALRARRDALPAMATEFYELLAEAPEIRGTDEPDRAEVTRLPDGRVEVRLSRRADPASETYFRRVFTPGETREVRVFLLGGDDEATVEGPAGEIVVRVIGGAGNDLLVDRSGGPTAFYDSEGENRFTRGADTRVSEREPVEEVAQEEADDLLPRLERDWGVSRSWFAPYADLRPHVDFVVGGGPRWTRYGFRHRPYQTRAFARGLFAPLDALFGVEAGAAFHRESSATALELFAQASQLEATLFHGFGNDTRREPSGTARVWHTVLSAEALLRLPVARGTEVAVGPVARWTSSDVAPGSPAERLAPLGVDDLGMVGGRAEMTLDTRDDEHFPRRGARALLTGEAYPPLLGLDGAFARLEGRASTYLSLPLPTRPVLALRAGAARAVGDFPFFASAFLGGSRYLRGYSTERFAGDLMLSGGTELRVPLAELEVVVRGTLGALAFADAGRVYVDGESPGGWHTTVGPGLWFATPLGSVSATYGAGERKRLYLKLGLPY